MRFNTLKFQAAVLMCSVIGYALLLSLSLRWETQSRMNRDIANQAYLSAQQQLRAIAEEETGAAHDLPRYRKQQQRGLIGEENRNAWIQHLNDITASRHWPPIEYEFDPPQNVSESPPGLQLHSTTMRLHLLLMHEEAFLQLFAALPSSQLAPVIPRKCTLSPTHLKSRDAKLEAHCEFQWLTISIPEAAI